MKMHLYQFENLLFLANNIKAVAEHVATTHDRTNYNIQCLPDDTLVEMNGKAWDINDLNRHYQSKARKNGYAVTDSLSILVNDGKVILIDTVLSPRNHQKITFFDATSNFDLSTA